MSENKKINLIVLFRSGREPGPCTWLLRQLEVDCRLQEIRLGIGAKQHLEALAFHKVLVSADRLYLCSAGLTPEEIREMFEIKVSFKSSLASMSYFSNVYQYVQTCPCARSVHQHVFEIAAALSKARQVSPQDGAICWDMIASAALWQMPCEYDDTHELH